jgi:hypothetical protein
MKSFSLIFLLFSLNILVSGQKRDYYITDSNTLSINVRIYEGTKTENAAFCHVKKGDQIIRYSPDEIKEYGFKDGRVYIAKEISIADSTQMVFLERLVDGKLKLYYYCCKGTDMFFLEEKDGTLVPLRKKDSFRGILAEFTNDCPDISSKSKLVNYDKRILSNYLLEYNECKSLHLPMLRFGVFAGLAHTKPVTINMSSEINSNFTYNPSNNLYFGFFLNLPINTSDFSLYSSIGFFESSYSSSLSTNDYDAGIMIKHSSLLVPVLLKYAPLKGRITPYLNIGVNYLYNLKNENILYKALDVSNTVQFEYFEAEVFTDHQLGCTFGAGFQYEINFKRVIFIELNLNREFSVNQSQSLYNLNLIQLTSGINL